MTRSQIIKNIMNDVSGEDIVISSTGYISRSVYETKDRPLNFYMMGSMGCALGIGIGIAMHIQNKVYVISGDGSVLMSLGTIITQESLRLPNLHHYIIDNGMHESTGGQPTNFKYLDVSEIGNTKTFLAERDPHVPPRITLSPEEITERFKHAVNQIRHK